MAESFRNRSRNLGGDENTRRNKRRDELRSLRKEKRDQLLVQLRQIGTENEPMKNDSDVITDIDVSVRQISVCINQKDNKILLRGLQLAHQLMNQESVSCSEHFTFVDMMGKCVEFLQMKDNPDIQHEALSLITKIAPAQPNYVKFAVIPPLIGMLRDSHPQLVKIGCVVVRDFINFGGLISFEFLEKGLIPSLINSLENHAGNVEVIRQVSSTFANVFIDDNTIPPQYVPNAVSECLPALVQMLSMNDLELLATTCQTFFHLCEEHRYQTQKIVSAGVLPRFSELLDLEDSAIVLPSLRTIRSIVDIEKGRSMTQEAVESGIVPKLMKLLKSQNFEILMEVVCILSDISMNHVSTIMEAGDIRWLFNVIENGSNSFQYEALWIIRHMTNFDSKTNIKTLCDLGIMPFLCKWLSITSWEIVLIVMEIIQNIIEYAGPELPRSQVLNMLKECNCLHKMEELVFNENELVRYRANWIIVNHINKNTVDENVSMEENIAEEIEMDFEELQIEDLS